MGIGWDSISIDDLVHDYLLLVASTEMVVATEASSETTEIQKEADWMVLALTVDSLARFLLGST